MQAAIAAMPWMEHHKNETLYILPCLLETAEGETVDYKKIALDVLKYAGGKENIKGATHCVTRLRLILNDPEKYDRKALENVEGAKGGFTTAAS